MDVRIIPYDDQYKGRVFAFTDACFRELGKQFDPSGRHRFYENIENVFDVFYCLIAGNELVGTVALKKFNDDTVELKALYLDRTFRGKGLGRQLLEKAVTDARRLGYKSIVLDSMSQYEDALRLYRKVGFKDTTRYNDNSFADVFMKLDL